MNYTKCTKSESEVTYGKWSSKQASIHTQAQWSHASVISTSCVATLAE